MRRAALLGLACLAAMLGRPLREVRGRSAFKGVTYQIWAGPSGAPAGSGGVLTVLTASTTPAPYANCVPGGAGDCTPPYWEPSNVDFAIPNQPCTITWDLLF